jgi:chromosome partitioning protein
MTKSRARSRGKRSENTEAETVSLKPEPQGSTLKAGVRVLLLASSKGGSGKTTTAINLAVQATHSGLRVVTIDMDRQETLTKWARLRPSEAPAIEHHTIPIGNFHEALDLIEVLAEADLVIVDTPPGIEDHPVAMRLLLRRTDFCVVPTSQSPADLNSVIEWMGSVQREEVATAFVINRSKRKNNSFGRAKLRLNRAGTLCPFDVRDLEDISSIHDVGVGVQEIGGAQGREDVEGVWDYVRKQMGI